MANQNPDGELRFCKLKPRTLADFTFFTLLLYLVDDSIHCTCIQD